MKKQPKVSIVIPVYNVEEYLVKCLDSLRLQTLQDIEVICIDDGSTDNSYRILQEYARRDSRFIVLSQENQGQGVARNVGIGMARGEYVGFVDPDDWVSSDYYENMYNQAAALGSEIVMSDLVKYQQWDEKSWKHPLWIRATSASTNEQLDVPAGQNISRDIIMKMLLVSPCYSVLRIYKTELLQKNKIMFTADRCYEDVMFIVRSHLLAQNISYCPSAVYFYRLNKSSTLRSLNERYLLLLGVYQKVKDFLAQENMSDELSLNMDYFITMNSVWTYNGLGQPYRSRFMKLLQQTDIGPDNLRTVLKLTNQLFSHRIHKFVRRLFYIKDRGTTRTVGVFGIKIKFKHRDPQSIKERAFIRQVKKNQAKYTQDSYLLFDCLHDNTVECIDAYSLFMQYRANNKNAYYVCLKDTALYQQLAAENKLENIIGLDASSLTNAGDMMERLYDVLLRTRAVITSFGENTSTTNRFFRKNKHWKYIFIQHGPTFMKESVFSIGYMNSGKFSHTLVASPFESKMFKKYGWSDDSLIKCGLPRWDLLPQENLKPQKKILVMLTWRRINHVNFEESLYKKNLLSLLHNKELQAYLSKNKIQVYFAPHHALSHTMKINFNINSKNIKIVDTGKISAYIHECDMLVTDLSSVAFDFMFQNKPVVLYVLDRYCTRLNKNERKDMERFDYKQYLIPNVVFNENDAVEKIKQFVESNFQLDDETRQKYSEFFFTKDNIRQQLIEQIDEICNQ